MWMSEIPQHDSAAIALYGIYGKTVINRERQNVALDRTDRRTQSLCEAGYGCLSHTKKNTNNLVSTLICAHGFTSLRLMLNKC